MFVDSVVWSQMQRQEGLMWGFVVDDLDAFTELAVLVSPHVGEPDPSWRKVL